jgi:hypothetical protein
MGRALEGSYGRDITPRVKKSILVAVNDIAPAHANH